MSLLALNVLSCVSPFLIAGVFAIILLIVIRKFSLVRILERIDWRILIVILFALGGLSVPISYGVINITRESNPAKKWIVSSNALGDTALTLLAEDKLNTGVSWLYSNDRPALELRCRGKELDALVNASIKVQNLGSFSSSARVRFDQTDPVELTMAIADSGDALFFDNPTSAIQTMLQYNTLAFQFHGSDGNVRTTTFDLRGLSTAVANQASSCPWPSA